MASADGGCPAHGQADGPHAASERGKRNYGDGGREVDQILVIVSAAAAERDQLIKEVESACNVYVPGPTVLEGKDEHIDWLPDRRGEIDWRLWRRYQQYLEDVKDWVPQATCQTR